MTAPTTPSPERQPADAGGVVRELAMQLARSIASLGYPVGMGVAPPEDACMKAAQDIIDIYGPALSIPAPQAQPDARAWLVQEFNHDGVLRSEFAVVGDQPWSGERGADQITTQPLYLSAPAADDGWRDIESAPQNQKEMFVVQAFGVVNGFTGPSPYTSDPVCVWAEDGEFMRWPHNFSPMHWRPLPAPPVALHPAAPTDEVGKS